MTSNTNGAPQDAHFEEERPRERAQQSTALEDDDEPIKLPTRREIDAAVDKAKNVIAPLLEMTFLGVSLYATAKLTWESAKRKAAKRAKERK